MRGALALLPVILAAACLDSSPEQDSTGRSPDVAQMSRTEPKCGISAGTLVNKHGLGLFKIGASASKVLNECPLARATIESDNEGNPQRTILFHWSGGGEIRALVDHGSIWRLLVTTPHRAAGSGLGVASTLGNLLAHGDATGLEGDGLLYVILANHCGISFRLDYALEPEDYRGSWTFARLSRLPRETRVAEVLVYDCVDPRW